MENKHPLKLLFEWQTRAREHKQNETWNKKRGENTLEVIRESKIYTTAKLIGKRLSVSEEKRSEVGEIENRGWQIIIKRDDSVMK